MIPKIKIKLCSVWHSRIISILHRACFDETWTEPAIQQTLSMPGMVAYLAFQKDKPHAFIVGRIVADEAEILAIGVTPSWRRKGIARSLLKTFLKKVKSQGAKFVFLEVADDNYAACSLYTLGQFQEAGRRVNYYKRGKKRVDALILKKVL